VELFAREGAKVAFTGRRQALGVALQNRLCSAIAPDCAFFIEADHAKPGTLHYRHRHKVFFFAFSSCGLYSTKVLLDDCKKAVASTIEHYGQIDILFNNAGIVLLGRTAEETSEEEWAEVMNLNVTAVWRMSKEVIPHFRYLPFPLPFYSTQRFGR